MIIEYKGKRPNISPSAFIAPTAVLIGDVTVGDEASIWWGAVLRSDQNANPIVVGDRTSVQDNCVIHSGEAPTIIEADCTIGHAPSWKVPSLNGGAIGMNVTLLENVEIGEEASHRGRQRRRSAYQNSAAFLAAGKDQSEKRAHRRGHWIKMGSSTYVNCAGVTFPATTDHRLGEAGGTDSRDLSTGGRV